MENSDSNFKIQSNKRTTQRNVVGSNFGFPGLVAGIRKGLSSSELSGIPSLGSPPRLKLPRSSLNLRRWTWDCDKVGLNIINSPKDDSEGAGGALDLQKKTGILFRSQIKRNSVSATNADRILLKPSTKIDFMCKNYMVSPPFRYIPDDCKTGGSNVVSGSEGIVVAEFQPYRSPNFLLDNKVPSPVEGRIPPKNNPISQSISSMHGNVNINRGALIGGQTLGENSLAIQQKLVSLPIVSSQKQTGPLPVTDGRHSEDYTCITFHGPTPRTTHISGGNVLECSISEIAKSGRNNESRSELDSSTYSPIEFLCRCFMCKKNLYCKDIYMYRDECFCSPECREEKIYADVSAKRRSSSKSSRTSSKDDIFTKRKSLK